MHEAAMARLDDVVQVLLLQRDLAPPKLQHVLAEELAPGAWGAGASSA